MRRPAEKLHSQRAAANAPGPHETRGAAGDLAIDHFARPCSARSLGRRCPTKRSSPPTQGLDNKDFFVPRQRVRQIEHLLPIDKDAHVAAYLALLIDHAETDAGIAAVGEIAATEYLYAPGKVDQVPPFCSFR